ncbi:MAG TPA: hypothetical protein VEI54_08615 [Candidatus Limnocylindrales bacterium]|nr:hypothetical protein [Candidatus Limnocylindrales bacterium]
MSNWIPRAALSAGCALLFAAASFAAEKYNHVEYMKPKVEGQKKDDHPVKGSISFDKDKKSVEFSDEKGASVISIPNEKIKNMLYEQTSKPRYAEAILISPFFLFTHSKKHFLTIQYADLDGQGKFALFHMDKSNARDIVATAEAETGKKVERSEEK